MTLRTLNYGNYGIFLIMGHAGFCRRDPFCHSLLGGSGVVISGVLSPLIWVISIVTLLITLLTTTPEPPSILMYSGPDTQLDDSSPSSAAKSVP